MCWDATALAFNSLRSFESVSFLLTSVLYCIIHCIFGCYARITAISADNSVLLSRVFVCAKYEMEVLVISIYLIGLQDQLTGNFPKSVC